jgi:ribosomal protein S24E
MDISVVEDRENPFFKRRELKIEVKHPKMVTPSKAELKKELARIHNVPEEQVIIDYIFGAKGMGQSMAKVKILKEPPKIEAKAVGEKVETQESKTA